MKAKATEYLPSRRSEPGAVFVERAAQAFYENCIGSIVDWYGATVFRREPLLSFTGQNERGKAFFAELVEDCDQRGTGLTDFFRARLLEAMVTGTSYVLVDFPRGAKTAETRAEEDALGVSRAYLVGYAAEELVNWSKDERGNFEWVVLRTQQARKPHIEDDEWSEVTTWNYYDRSRYRVYQQWRTAGAAGPVTLVDEGWHGLAKQNRVPLFGMEMQEGLWLLNRAASLQLEHFAKANGLAWAINSSLFAMPVVYTRREWNQIIGEAYYLQLEPGDSFGWAEPEGRVYEIAQQNLQRLKEEIYRVCYLPQAGGPLNGNAQSGLSKQRDFSLTYEVLRAYGDAVKDLLKRVLKAVEAAREDGLTVEVTGLDEFDIGDFSSELEDAERLLRLEIGSATLRQQVFKRLALKYLCDVRQELKDRIVSEIEAALSPGR
jgi:hypothetical protein